MTLDQKFIDFMIPENDELINYSHRTKTERIADIIMNEGFEFVDSLQKTTDTVSKDPVHLQYWHNLRERYGNFTVVLSISKALMDKYIVKLNQIKNSHVSVEQLFSIKDIYLDDNDEEVYTLPPAYVKGYFNCKTGSIVKNNNFNPYFEDIIFTENLNKLMNV